MTTINVGDITVETLEVTPDLAKQMLDANEVNRNPSDDRVERYARAMRNGDWRFIGDPIRQSTDGRVLDGQHRLKAIEKSGITVTLVVVRGIPVEHQKYMDAGRARKAADSVHMMGIKNSTTVAAAARLLMVVTNNPAPGEDWDGIVRVGQYAAKVQGFSNYEVADYVEAHKNLATSAEIGVQASRGVSAQPTALALVHYLARRLDPYKADAYMTHLATGVDIGYGSPVFAVRETINRRNRGDNSARSDGAVNLALLVLAWNHWRRDTKLTKIQLPPGGVVASTTLTMI